MSKRSVGVDTPRVRIKHSVILSWAIRSVVPVSCSVVRTVQPTGHGGRNEYLERAAGGREMSEGLVMMILVVVVMLIALRVGQP